MSEGVKTYTKTITFQIEYGEGKGEANRIDSIIASIEAAGCKLVRIQQEVDRIDGKPRVAYPNTFYGED